MTEPAYSVQLSPTAEPEHSAECLSRVELGQPVRFLHHLDLGWPSFSSSVLALRTPEKAAPEFETSQDPRPPCHSLPHRRREPVSWSSTYSQTSVVVGLPVHRVSLETVFVL